MKEFKDFLDSATDGAVLFSLGSEVKMSEYLSEEKLDILLTFFGSLKQKIIMKWELDELQDKPDNVMITKWHPQNAILAHRNVVLFMSQCGKNSVNEARFHGVPILGMPVYGEQHLNLKIAMDEGWALPFSYSFMNENSLRFSFNETLNNTRYRDNVRGNVDYFKDRPKPALATAIYWVEYVLRHNGAKHMQSQAVYLNWFQYHSLDVIGFLALVLYISYRIFKCILKCLWCCCFARKVTTVKGEKLVVKNVASKKEESKTTKTKSATKGKPKKE